MNVRTADTINHAANYIAHLSAMDDIVLQRKLRIVRAQMELAFQQQKEDSFELLQIWEEQIIAARYLRNEEDQKQPEIRKKIRKRERKVTGEIEIKDQTDVDDFPQNISPILSSNQLVLF